MKKYIDKHFGKSFIQSSSSAVASLILLVWKPERGLRFCIDYQALNAVTIKNRYLIPLIFETLGKLARAVWHTKLDVIHAFNQIRMKEDHERLTVFNNRYGQFKYLMMPFKLCNAPNTFQSYINKSLLKYLDVFYTAYLDNMLIYNIKKKNYVNHVLQVLKQLHKQRLQVNIDKCKFSIKKIKYFGIIVTTDGIKINIKKKKAI